MCLFGISVSWSYATYLLVTLFSWFCHFSFFHSMLKNWMIARFRLSDMPDVICKQGSAGGANIGPPALPANYTPPAYGMWSVFHGIATCCAVSNFILVLHCGLLL